MNYGVYIMQLVILSLSLNCMQVVGASVVMAEITGLMAYTNYTVQVAAVNDQGVEGPLSQAVSIFTPEAG